METYLVRFRSVRPGMTVLLDDRPALVEGVASVHWKHSRGRQGRDLHLTGGRSLRAHQSAAIHVLWHPPLVRL
jgi:hypothetical protein